MIDFDINNIDLLYFGERGEVLRPNQRYIMIDVVYEGNTFRFYLDGGRAFWLCVSRGSENPNSQAFSGENLVAPSGFWKELRKAAIENGTDAASFRSPVKEKKTKRERKRSRELLKNVISIF